MAKLFDRDLRQGSTGAAVNVLALLMIAAWYGNDEKKIVLDGEYTPDGAIAAAVKGFQASEDLPQTGDFDAQTRERFRQEFLDDEDIDIDTFTVEMFSAPTVYASAPNAHPEDRTDHTTDGRSNEVG
ncbi:MAG: hypothetical protein V4474_04115 [Patescibacteria group bacterium]